MTNLDCSTEEIWKDIPQWEGLYQASSHGRIRRIGPHKRFDGILRGSIVKTYLRVCLRREVQGKKYYRLVHILVASTFIGKIPVGLQVNHEDGDKMHNWPGNLTYMTPKQNVEHAHATGLREYTGENNPFAKFSDELIQKVRAERAKGGVTATYRALSSRFGISRTHVRRIVMDKARNKMTPKGQSWD